MIYIRKRKTPNIIVEKATAIKKDPASGDEKLEGFNSAEVFVRTNAQSYNTFRID